MRTVKRGLPLQFFHRGDELADILDLGLLVHADDDVERVLDLGDEIHHRQAVPFEIAGKGGGVGQIGALLVERFDQAVNLILESGAHGCVPKDGELRAAMPRHHPLGKRMRRQSGTIFPSRKSEEHTSELQSLMRISYAVFCLKKKKKHTNN